MSDNNKTVRRQNLHIVGKASLIYRLFVSISFLKKWKKPLIVEMKSSIRYTDIFRLVLTLFNEKASIFQPLRFIQFSLGTSILFTGRSEIA